MDTEYFCDCCGCDTCKIVEQEKGELVIYLCLACYLGGVDLDAVAEQIGV